MFLGHSHRQQYVKRQHYLLYHEKGPPVKTDEAVAWYGIESIMTALLGESALFVPGYGCPFPLAPSSFDRLVSGYRLI